MPSIRQTRWKTWSERNLARLLFMTNASHTARITPSFLTCSYINWLSNIDRSSYNALQTTFTGRAYHGLSFLGAYTYSHSLDDYSTARGIHTPMNNLQPNLDYGNSDFDQRHHFSFTLNYAIPGRKGYGQMLEGWVVNSAVLIQSGLPWYPVDTSDISKSGDKKSDRWDFFGNPSDFTAGKNPIPFYAGGSANMPAMCTQEATAIGDLANLGTFGCFAQGNSVLYRAANRHVWNRRAEYLPRRWLPRLGFFLVQELYGKRKAYGSVPRGSLQHPESLDSGESGQRQS